MSGTKYKRALAAAVLLLAVIVFFAAPTHSAKADMFPKPTLTISFENMGDEKCYCTLLSETESTGPWSAYDPSPDDPDYIPHWVEDDPEEYAVWRAFLGYSDGDGFYYLQYHLRCDETKSFEWNYYAPHTFKILLYFPETQTFSVGGIMETYAFNSYFTATLSNNGIGSIARPAPVISSRRSYDYGSEIGKLVARVMITVGLELLVALMFRLKKGREIVAVLAVNVIILLPLVYLIAEAAVFGLEAFTYRMIFDHPKFAATPAERVSTATIVLYAFVANAVSLAFGLCVTIFAPNIAY